MYNPALILQAGAWDILQAVTTATIGVVLLSSSFEGYLVGIGSLRIYLRLIFGLAGILLAIPESRTDVLGIAIAAATFLVARLAISREKRRGLKDAGKAS